MPCSCSGAPEVKPASFAEIRNAQIKRWGHFDVPKSSRNIYPAVLIAPSSTGQRNVPGQSGQKIVQPPPATQTKEIVSASKPVSHSPQSRNFYPSLLMAPSSRTTPSPSNSPQKVSVDQAIKAFGSVPQKVVHASNIFGSGHRRGQSAALSLIQGGL